MVLTSYLKKKLLSVVKVGEFLYEVVTRGEAKYFNRNDVIGGVDVEKDDDMILTQMSDFVMEFRKNRNPAAIGEWFVNRGGNNEL